MYLVIVKNIVKEDGINDYIETSKKFAEDTSNIKGCLGSEVYKEVNTSNCVVNIERWENKEVFEAYDGSIFLKYKEELKKNFINNTTTILELV